MKYYKTKLPKHRVNNDSRNITNMFWPGKNG